MCINNCILSIRQVSQLRQARMIVSMLGCSCSVHCWWMVITVSHLLFQTKDFNKKLSCRWQTARRICAYRYAMAWL